MKTGIKLIKPDQDISKNYLKQAETTLQRAEQLIKENDFLWASVTTYYAAYYSIYAFLAKLGIKSENHDCSIELINYLLNESILIKNIFSLKQARKDGQYYLKFSDKKELINNLQIAKIIYIKFYNLCDLNNSELNKYRIKINKYFS